MSEPQAMKDINPPKPNHHFMVYQIPLGYLQMDCQQCQARIRVDCEDEMAAHKLRIFCMQHRHDGAIWNVEAVCKQQ